MPCQKAHFSRISIALRFLRSANSSSLANPQWVPLAVFVGCLADAVITANVTQNAMKYALFSMGLLAGTKVDSECRKSPRRIAQIRSLHALNLGILIPNVQLEGWFFYKAQDSTFAGWPPASVRTRCDVTVDVVYFEKCPSTKFPDVTG